LNLAGMFVVIVAVAPTMDIDRCWSIPPGPSPINEDASVAPWVIANIRNNMLALLSAGAVGFVVSLLIRLAPRRRDDRGLLPSPKAIFPLPKQDRARDVRLIGAAGLVLAVTWIVLAVWDNFYTRAHGYAAVAFFIFLIAAVSFQARYQWTRTDPTKRRWGKLYGIIALLMLLVGGIALIADLGDYEVGLLEVAEILMFAGYWLGQTFEKRERKDAAEPVVASSA
jgi:accessory gene regulator protein AgrB